MIGWGEKLSPPVVDPGWRCTTRSYGMLDVCAIATGTMNMNVIVIITMNNNNTYLQTILSEIIKTQNTQNAQINKKMPLNISIYND